MKNNFDYNDINLIPRKCIVESRSECDTSAKLGNFVFTSPIIPANMKAVINEEIAIKLAENGYFYVMHRFDIDEETFIKTMKDKNLISSISLGVNNESYDLIEVLISKNLIPDYITIDIAHGHAIKMEEMLKFLKLKLGDNSFLIAGNISTPDAARDLIQWGADAIKVGIGPGSACTTYPETGFGSRGAQASIVKKISNISTVPVIADGGIKTSGEITKSIVLGATMTMVGGMMSGFIDSPGNIIQKDGKQYKEFYGSASVANGDKTCRIEGKHMLIDLKIETMLEYLKKVEESLQSAISYAGGEVLNDLNEVKYFIKE